MTPFRVGFGPCHQHERQAIRSGSYPKPRPTLGPSSTLIQTRHDTRQPVPSGGITLAYFTIFCELKNQGNQGPISVTIEWMWRSLPDSSSWIQLSRGVTVRIGRILLSEVASVDPAICPWVWRSRSGWPGTRRNILGCEQLGATGATFDKNAIAVCAPIVHELSWTIVY